MLRDKDKRLQILARVDEITDTHCKGCEVKDKNSSFCLNGCVHGEELSRLGNMLGSSYEIKKPKPKPKVKPKPKRKIKPEIKKEDVKVEKIKEPKLIKSTKVEKTKEECKRLLDEGYKVKQIAELMGLSPNNLSTLKNNKWGLNGYRPDHKKGIVVGYDLREETTSMAKEAPVVDANEAEDRTKKLHGEIMRLKKENEEIGKLRGENGELSELIEGMKKKIDELFKSREKIGFRYKDVMKANDELAHTNSHLRSQVHALKKEKSEPVESAYDGLVERNYTQVKQALEEMNISYADLENQLDDANATVSTLKDVLKLLL